MVNVVRYHWGQYAEEGEIPPSDIQEMVQLAPEDLLGIDLKPEHRGLTFYAYESDIERSEYEGTGVKNAYGLLTEANPASALDQPMKEAFVNEAAYHAFVAGSVEDAIRFVEEQTEGRIDMNAYYIRNQPVLNAAIAQIHAIIRDAARRLP